MLAKDVVIDPFLLCLPNPCDSLDRLEDFIAALVGWRGFIDRPDTCVLMSDAARVALNDDGEYPHRHRLLELIDKFECTFADANTISKVANSILDRTPALEEHYGIDAILFDENSHEIVPALMLDRLKPKCRSAFRDDLLITGLKIDEGISARTIASVLVASGGWRGNPIPEDIAVKANVYDVGLLTTDVSLKTVPPFSLLQNIPVAFSHEQLIKSLDLWSIWDGASSESAVRLSIETCIKNLISSGTSRDGAMDFEIGSGFVHSLHTWGANSRHDYAMVIIESCARIVLGMPKNSINEFRESAKATAKQRIRVDDGALAFRTHLTKKGVGLRLMFWRLAGGTIEFANIGAKGDLEIL
ncbi:hypothetical protein [Solidesulfovibrio carbinolicus]|nr:hypothetical protein [Solidesulfovibrio carbinolicus]